MWNTVITLHFGIFFCPVQSLPFLFFFFSRKVSIETSLQILVYNLVFTPVSALTYDIKYMCILFYTCLFCSCLSYSCQYLTTRVYNTYMYLYTFLNIVNHHYLSTNLSIVVQTFFSIHLSIHTSLYVLDCTYLCLHFRYTFIYIFLLCISFP